MIGVEKKFTTKIKPMENDIEVRIKENEIELVLNANSIFSILSNRKNIIGLINMKTDELVEEHIGKMASLQAKGKYAYNTTK